MSLEMLLDFIAELSLDEGDYCNSTVSDLCFS